MKLSSLSIHEVSNVAQKSNLDFLTQLRNNVILTVSAYWPWHFVIQRLNLILLSVFAYFAAE
jgi:hypothetical protein